jgi:hypothetical protein
MGLQDLKDDIDKLKAKLDAQEGFKEKKFRYPFGKKVGKSQKKKNYVTILIVNENGNCDFKKYQITDQTILHDLIPRIAGAGHVMRDKKGNPLIILPNWSLEPFSPLEYYEKSFITGNNTAGFKLLMARMESEKVLAKKKMGKILPWIIGIGLAAIIIYAIVSGGKGK